jgi:hypothetical protein
MGTSTITSRRRAAISAGHLKIGNTPLVRLDRIAKGLRAIEIYAKAEFLNPGGSVKDRPALAMIEDGERRGLLTPDRIILDATSGNTGIAYAMIAAARGYRVRLCLPRNASVERQRILRAYGAELVLTDPAEGSDGAIRECRRIYAEAPERYFYPDQYNNPPTGVPIFALPAPRSSGRPEGGSRTSSLPWAPAGPSWASAVGYVVMCRASSAGRCNPPLRFTVSKG